MTQQAAPQAPQDLSPAQVAPREQALPESRAGWRRALLALGHGGGVLAITTVSVVLSVVVTWLFNLLLRSPEALRQDLFVAVLVPLVVAPLVSHAAMGLLHEVEDARRLLYQAAVRDGLTQLYNRRFFLARLAAEVARARREGIALCTLLIDMDHFKAINDVHGHATGDEVLERTAALLIEVLRPYDLVARYGGEEFVALMPGAALPEAMAVAERLRVAIANLDVPALGACAMPQVTASLGVAALGPPGEGAEAMLARADRAMYRAKHDGRNRCVAGEA